MTFLEWKKVPSSIPMRRFFASIALILSLTTPANAQNYITQQDVAFWQQFLEISTQHTLRDATTLRPEQIIVYGRGSCRSIDRTGNLNLALMTLDGLNVPSGVASRIVIAAIDVYCPEYGYLLGRQNGQ